MKKIKDKKEGKHFPKLKKKTKIIIGIVIIIICLIGLSIASFQIIKWNKDNNALKSQLDEINGITSIDELPVDEDNEELINPPSEPTEESDYYKYIQLPLINVDFDELLKVNSDTVAWLHVNGTTINYPVVQASDNDYYLTRDFKKYKNSGGWVFLDYRNDINNLQDNTIIYAHGRMNNIMFGSLKNILNSSWYQDTDNYVVNISTPKYNTLWQVISVYSLPTETYYLTSSFGSVESKRQFLETIIGRSKFDFNSTVNTDDKILTLSTCLNDNEKVVLHAKLIKQQAR